MSEATPFMLLSVVLALGVLSFAVGLAFGWDASDD